MCVLVCRRRVRRWMFQLWSAPAPFQRLVSSWIISCPWLSIRYQTVFYKDILVGRRKCINIHPISGKWYSHVWQNWHCCLGGVSSIKPSIKGLILWTLSELFTHKDVLLPVIYLCIAIIEITGKFLTHRIMSFWAQPCCWPCCWPFSSFVLL